MSLSDALQLLVDGAEAGPLPGLVGPALFHEPEHSIGTQLGAGQAAPYEDRHDTPRVRRASEGPWQPRGTSVSNGSCLSHTVPKELLLPTESPKDAEVLITIPPCASCITSVSLSFFSPVKGTYYSLPHLL